MAMVVAVLADETIAVQFEPVRKHKLHLEVLDDKFLAGNKVGAAGCVLVINSL